MDVWIIAAAAGAGYVAQRFKKLATGTKGRCSDLSSEKLEAESVHPGNVKYVPETLGDEMCRQRGQALLGASPLDIASTSGSRGGNVVVLDDYESSNNEDTQGDEDVTRNSIEVSYGIRRNRNGLRSRRVNSRFIKPRNSLESCLMAQLYNENSEMEEYTYSVRAPIVRPFLVCDGSRIISRGPHQSCSSKQTGTGNYKLQKDRTGHCVPRLPNVLPVELQMKAEAKTGNAHVWLSSNSGETLNGYQNNAQGGSSSDGSLLFYLGLTMGITYSSLRHKLEMDKLRKSLKHTEDLVQDLQEELEMKDASTVKELAVEDYEESVDVHNDSYFNDDALQALSPEQKLDSSPRHCNDEYFGRKAEEESMSEIEAELEAELYRLESNMNSSRLDKKLSHVAEIDADFVSDVIEGDLRADLFGAKTSTQQTYADRDVSSSSPTTRSVHYAVSPRELALRLHQVIQSRLEERVRELETALEQSQAKIKCTADFPNPKTGNSSNHESPIAAVVDQPVVINLSGEALSAYNESYEELTKLSESDEEESGRDADFGLLDGYVEQHSMIPNGSRKAGFSSGQEEDAHMNPSNDVTCNSSEDGEDEMERLLIKQIVEKARQGSPAVLKVQRALLSSDENYI